MRGIKIEEIKKNYYKVISYFSMQIREGKLEKGDRIPSERELVKNLKIGRNSIREALKVLEIVGLLERKQGVGTFIKREFNNFFSTPLTIICMLNNYKGNEIFEFRSMIEIEIAKISACRLNNENRVLLESMYKKLIEEPIETKKSLYDSSFHKIIAKSTENIIIINVYNAMETMMNLFIKDIREIAFINNDEDLVNESHREIFMSIINKKPERAMISMEKHMEIIKKHYNEQKIHFNYDKGSIENKILRYIVFKIEEGELKKGDKLPSERELKEKLNTTRTAVREVYKTLYTLGIIEYKPSVGTFIRINIKGWLFEPMDIMFKISGVTHKDIFEFRNMIEIKIAMLASERITDNEILELKNIYSLMNKTKSRNERSVLDEKFHYLIAKSSRNQIIYSIYNAISPMMDSFTYKVRNEFLKNESEYKLDEMHKNILKAIIRRDKKLARKYAKIHMKAINKYFKKNNC